MTMSRLDQFLNGARLSYVMPNLLLTDRDVRTELAALYGRTDVHWSCIPKGLRPFSEYQTCRGTLAVWENKAHFIVAWTEAH